MKPINVFSEIGILKKVLVHTPGKEIEYISPQRLDELLFSAILEPKQAREEHKRFIKILEDNGVEVVQLVDLIVETYKHATKEEKNKLIEEWLTEVKPKITESSLRDKIKSHILDQKSILEMIKKMMSGFYAKEINVKSKHEFIVDPIPNLFFTRDPFATVGDAITIHKMKYKTRQRETLFSKFIFDVHPEYKDVKKYTKRNGKYTIEGGDVFIYNSETLVIGVSERTEFEVIQQIAEKLAIEKNTTFKRIFAINIPKMGNLMHLDTWLTMIDYDKFIYSPNMLGELKIWEITLDSISKKPVKLNIKLEAMLKKIIGVKPILIPVGGHNASQLDIDLETHFDATNYLTIAPGVVIGYDRNVKTEAALKEVGVKVLSFEGNQLSLGMGSARCMSMPLIREDLPLKNKK